MIKTRSLIFILWIACASNFPAGAQSIASHQLAGAEVYVGSTPCDSFIHSLLEIKSANLCEFMKWELQLQRHKPDSFELTVCYGESKPNTNWFKNDGEKLELKGKYSIDAGNAANSKAKVYLLHAENLISPILLIEMDPYIFHFADQQRNFLVGNAGYSYVLNRITR